MESLFVKFSIVCCFFTFSSDCTLEYRLRCSIMELYSVLWGKVTPPCVPSHGVSTALLLLKNVSGSGGEQ